ncbi:MAG: outer membrane lipoprotein carrier protein LolA [Candidatus Kapabacteria bacterium]|nr:outer membrane lipoprotein carrier protein LolA [Candidatus Kapabacteria bacterium]MCS7169504.1 outer membrane lipoprotein carrier protein LolA [Candidatus Kapabacteria bacterium]MDW7996434.1 outer membrane lipoprotein carrier protein LolA [Bacteroidota bacterium]MDW8224509.1 outer membrane lipoprotein carrier protein LolA [Bacteroidota bacterium]
MRLQAFFFMLVFSTLQADDELRFLRHFYARLQSLVLEAVSDMGVEVRLTVARGNRFRAELPGRLLISNGTTIWSYSPQYQQVVVSSTARAYPSGGIERVFTTLLQHSKLRLSHRNGDTLHVVCIPSDPTATGFREAILVVRRQDWAPLAAEIRSNGGGSQRWQIRRFQANPAVSAADFHFQPPPGTEVIELRR